MMRRILISVTLLLATGIAACGIPRWPVEGPMTSPYGVRWRGLLPGIHRGVDIFVPTGTPVRAMAEGRVRFAGVQRGYGNVVWLDHGGAVLTVYAHLSRVNVSTGQAVARDQVVGASGESGNAAGPHLHFEVWRWGQPVDPVPLLGRPPAGPTPVP